MARRRGIVAVLALFVWILLGVPPRAVLDNWDRFTPSGPRRSLEWLAVTVFAFREALGVPGAVTSTSPLTAAHCATDVVYSRLEL